MLTINFRDFPLQAGDIVLDLGCGEGRHAINVYLQEKVLSIGVDINVGDLQVARERAQPFLQENQGRTLVLKQADATCLPFADNSLDKIICSEVLEHIPDYYAVLREITRVLKPGGLLAVTVPRAWPEKICWWLSDEYHQVEGGHIRIFNGSELRSDIEKLSFTFYRRHWAHALHSPFWWMKCLWWKTQDTNPLIRLYHRLLVWDLMQKPWITQTLEKLLNPVMGKSLVMYFKKNNPTLTLPLAGEGINQSILADGSDNTSPLWRGRQGGGQE